MFEASLLGTTNNILCSNLNVSCSTYLKETLESKISPEEFVWFEDGQRNVEEFQKANELCPGLNEFVWFQDGDEDSEHKIAILSNKIIVFQLHTSKSEFWSSS